MQYARYVNITRRFLLAKSVVSVATHLQCDCRCTLPTEAQNKDTSIYCGAQK